MDRTEHMVVGEEVVKAQILDRSPDPPNRGRISPKLSLRINNADLHRIQPSLEMGLSTKRPRHGNGTGRARDHKCVHKRGNRHRRLTP